MNRQKIVLRYGSVLIVLFVFILITAALLGRDFWRISRHGTEKTLGPVSPGEFAAAEPADEEYTVDQKCLYIWEDDEQSLDAKDMMDVVLTQMKVPYVSVSSAQFQADMLDGCGTVVLGVTMLETLGEDAISIIDWVKAGGDLMCLYPPSRDSYLTAFAPMLGLQELGITMTAVNGFRFVKSFIPGAEERDYTISEPYPASLSIQLTDDCQLYMESTDTYPVPLLWRRQDGQGTVVVSNFGYVGKSYRGFYAAGLSLLGDCFAYPVINGAAFWIEGFPSPSPGGNSEFIQRDYRLGIDDFISDVWWPDMSGASEKYGFPYTGMVIEQYYTDVNGDVERNGDIVRYQYYGNDILSHGGELGYLGYNHMPLVLNNFNYGDAYEGYKKWESPGAMEAGMKELEEFCGYVFPREKFQTYTPPSNILSEEGRQMLAARFPQIKAIAGTYLPGEVVYEQEFGVADDGMIGVPKVTSGFLFDDSAKITALSELAFHYVSSHAVYPFDVLDREKGADIGWEEMYRRFLEYTEWLYGAAGGMRSLTGSELAGAVQRYDKLRIHRAMTKDAVIFRLDGFLDEAWLFVRFNTRQPKEMTGGKLTRLTDDLYLVQAEEPEITVTLE